MTIPEIPRPEYLHLENQMHDQLGRLDAVVTSLRASDIWRQKGPVHAIAWLTDELKTTRKGNLTGLAAEYATAIVRLAQLEEQARR